MNEIGWGSEKNQEMIRKYNSTAHIYDDRYRETQAKKYRLSINNIKVNSLYILDAGCGTGLLIEFLLENQSETFTKDFKFIGVDISINMIKEFIKKVECRPEPVKKVVNLILADLEYLPFRGEVFSLVLSYTSLQNLNSQESGVSELIRVSLSNSKIIFSILKKKIQLKSFIIKYRPVLKTLEILDNELLEDYIFMGKNL
ncbi:MAG: class I SAM-dependent methyltransferase [Promethearchaeota archaeon]